MTEVNQTNVRELRHCYYKSVGRGCFDGGSSSGY